jgi:transcriptional regulator with XRE-family HTH domain
VLASFAHDYAGRVPQSTTAKLLIVRLRESRKRHFLTQEQFSELSGVAYKYYQLIEIGKRIDLRLSTLEKLASAYSIGVSERLAPASPKTRMSALPTGKRKTSRKGLR